MKIDIGNGKILGTKKVSGNGQISGFTEYAGREVLVVLPDTEVDVELSPREYVDELRLAVDEHMRVAFDRYQVLKGRFRSHREAAEEFVASNAPRSFAGLYDKVDVWARDQITKARTRSPTTESEQE